ncbi:MAG: family N-acetyltransferase [Alphaproteobacteria bacterium]|nr:family N-acetyltransferase [Alphaproteobacteria bacterium]
MADEDRDKMLRAMAENRGCKLVKSRRRKPGGDHGRYGLKDAKTGQERFGFGDRGLTATPEQIEDWLRGSTVSEWKSSLKASAAAPPEAEPKRGKPANDDDVTSRPVRRAKPAARPPPPPPPAQPSPPPKPKLVVREAKPRDAEAVAALATELGFPATAAEIKRRLPRFAKAGEPLLVAEQGEVIGCLAWHAWNAIHRPKPVGRITMLVVTREARRRGVGAALLDEAERRFREAGCGLVEVTSNVDLGGAHDFYRGRGYERTSWRFVRSLEPAEG